MREVLSILPPLNAGRVARLHISGPQVRVEVMYGS